MFHRLGSFVARFWLVVILGWIALAAGLHSLAPTWDDVTQDGDLAYLPERMTSVRADQLMARAFPDNKAKSQVAIFCVRRDASLTKEDKDALESLVRQFAPGEPHELPVTNLWTPSSEAVGSKLLQRNAAVAIISLSTEFMAVQNIKVLEAVNAALDKARHDPAFPAGLELGVTGSAAVGGDMMSAAQESIQNTELWTILMVVGILAVVYRAPVLVVVPLVTIGVSVFVASDLVALLTEAKNLPGLEWLDFKVFKTTKIFVVTLLFGAGTDFCLFLISRYKEELAEGRARGEALVAALGQVGEAITASAFTTVCGLGMLYFADFGKFHNSGPTIGLCLVVALVACLTLAPALMRAFGSVVFWPRGVGLNVARNASAGSASGTLSSRFWTWASRRIIARPGLILVTSVVLLSPLAFAGLDVAISYDFISELDPSRPSVRGTRLLRQFFPAGEISPITVVVKQTDGQFNADEGKQNIARLTRALYGGSLNGKEPPTVEFKHLREIKGVASVRSLTEPLGDRPGLSNLFSGAGQRKLTTKSSPQSKANFVTPVAELEGQVTRFDVILTCDPFSAEAEATLTSLVHALDGLKADPESAWHGAEFDFLGVTSGTRDLKAVTKSDQILIQCLVVMAVLGVLIAVLRRPVFCLYLILSVLFSYYVTIGTTELVFAWLYPPFHGLDWKVPIFLFVILIAVGEDYNIYLATRVFEEQRRWGLVEGLRVAVEKTGGIITSCGVIMAGTFVSMMTGSLRGMLELGFALTLGVILDTLVVRPILVPAFLALVYRFQGQRPDETPADDALELAAAKSTAD